MAITFFMGGGSLSVAHSVPLPAPVTDKATIDHNLPAARPLAALVRTPFAAVMEPTPGRPGVGELP